MKFIKQALKTNAAKDLLSSGLKFASTERQMNNGTIVLVGKVKRKKISYMITATGAVLSNKFVARQVIADSQAKQYTVGIRAAKELFDKRMMA